MKALADELSPITADCREKGHPVDLFRVLETQYLRAAEVLSKERELSVPIPKLCTLVVASAFDAAIHDAYGKAFGVSCYETYGPSFMTRDLSHDLGPDVQGGVSRSVRPGHASCEHAGVPFRRRQRSARGIGRS